MTNEKALVLFSGGMDSATLLLYYKQVRKCNVTALLIDYGQRHRIELRYAKRFCKKYSIPYLEISLRTFFSQLKHIVKKSSPEKMHLYPLIMGTLKNVPKESKFKNVPISSVPYRNLLFIVVASVIASVLDFDVIGIAVTKHDGDYPDCTSEFFSKLKQVLEISSESKAPVVETPFLNLTKKEIVELGLKLGVDYSLTYSCYSGKEKPCGVCFACELRNYALQEIERESHTSLGYDNTQQKEVKQ